MKPQPTPEKGQHWRDTKHNVVRIIVDATNPWWVEMKNIVTGRETKVFRVSEWGRPARYEHVPKGPVIDAKEEAAEGDVHIRFQPGEGSRLTYCLKPVDELVTTTLDNLAFWRKRRPICTTCDKRRRDGNATLGEIKGGGVSCVDNVDDDACPKRADGTHCEHWQDGGPCCDCGAPADADVCASCGAADGHGPDCVVLALEVRR